MDTDCKPTLLGIPRELRNVIYLHIFTPEPTHELSTFNEPSDPIAIALKPTWDNDASRPEPCAPRHLRVLETCKQIHNEAYLLALSQTGFHVVGDATEPAIFKDKFEKVRDGKVAAVRHLLLTAKIAHLHAMNEQWGGYPFGNKALELDSLTIVPKRPDASQTTWHHIADLSQGHTLAHIFAETFKCLKNVKMVIVKNRGCFNCVIWRLVYRSVVYRIWRWGGGKCGLRFQCCSKDEEGSGEEWFRVWLQEGNEGNEVGEEVVRMVADGEALPRDATNDLMSV